MPEKTLVRLRFEIDQVDLLLDSYADLIESVRFGVPNLVEVTALASVLHSFYNGLEAIFLTIAQEIDSAISVYRLGSCQIRITIVHE